MEVIENLQSEELYSENYRGELTGRGIIHTEEQNLVDKERVLYHRNLRHKILSILFQIYKSEGYSAEIPLTKLTEIINKETNGFDINKIGNEYHLLSQIGLVKKVHPSISREGIEYWNTYLLLESFKNEFSDLENLKGITPQKRGRALQKLLAQVIKFAGCNTDEGVRRSHEEIDVTFEYNGNLFLIECKWEKEKTEAPVVRELKGKLDNRSEIKGMLASIAGFTSGTEDQVFEYINQKIILLFGKEDILQIINNPNSFKSLVDEKYKKLIVKKEVLWK
jgi:predicted transcriptional regulator with HTH domain